MRRMMFDIMFSILSRHESKPYVTGKNARWFSLRKPASCGRAPKLKTFGSKWRAVLLIC